MGVVLSTPWSYLPDFTVILIVEFVIHNCSFMSFFAKINTKTKFNMVSDVKKILPNKRPGHLFICLFFCLFAVKKQKPKKPIHQGPERFVRKTPVLH